MDHQPTPAWQFETAPPLPRLRISRLAAALMLVAACILPLAAQSFPAIDPADSLGVWDFDDPTQANQSPDLLAAIPIHFQGNTAFSASGAGRSGQAGDRAMNFGIAGNSSATLTHAAFMAMLNDRNLSGDRLSVVFWQRWNASIGNSSAIWFRSTSANGTNRGFQAHVPWSGGTVFFDTSGCCLSPSQRLTVAPAVNWQQWNHIALIKNGGAKQIWINGTLAASQASGAAPLLGDWTDILLGHPAGSPNDVMRGMIDDLAIFSTALESSHIAALAAGTDPLSLVVAPAERVPQLKALHPASGTTFHPLNGGLAFQATTVPPNILPAENVRLFLDGADITGTLAITGSPSDIAASSSVVLLPNRVYNVRAEVSDQAGRRATRHWFFDTADPATTPAYPPLDLSLLTLAAAPETIDGAPLTFAETADAPGSFLELELHRAVRATRIDLTAPVGAAYAGILAGARLQVFGLRDQLLFETTITQTDPGGVWGVFLPPGLDARLLRIDLPPGQTNGLGDHRLALADWRVTGDASPAAGPIDLRAAATVSQSSTNAGHTAAAAIDGNAATASETLNITNSHWQLTLDRDRPLHRVEIVAPNNATSTRLAGLTLRLLDGSSNTLATTTVTHPGAGGTWGFDVPPGTPPARHLRIGLENNATNGYGDHVVSLAEVSLITGTNVALGTPAYMVRLTDGLPSPSLANDGNHATFTETTTQTVDGYWETDLGQARTLHSVRVVAFDAGDHQRRLTNATLRLFDENHDPVHSQRLSGTSAVFDIALPGPVTARYVRIGLENKARTSPTGGLEWWLRLREVQAFGDETRVSGLAGFSATPAAIAAGESTTLEWQGSDLRELSLHPHVGSVGAFVGPSGAGSLVVSPAVTTEYLLVGTTRDGPVTRTATVTVGGQRLPPRISEFVASNRFSLSDGNRREPDWIELHNPNDIPLDLTGHGLSDQPNSPFKWVFPAGTTLPANSHLIVFASGDPEPFDPAGNLHAGFSLAAAGESVVLTAPDGTRLDAILNYPAQREDLAYGRALDGSLGFLTPTPRAHNLVPAVAGWLEAPVFSHSRGFHESPFSLVITHPDPAAEILVSLDGSEPATPYTGPIPVTGSVTVRATARRAGFLPPPVETHSYLNVASVMTSPLMNSTYTQGALSTRLRSGLSQIPTLSLTVPVLPDDYNERPASVEIFMPDGSPPVHVNAGLTRFGGAWTSFAKKSYRVRFRSQYGAKKLDFPLFRGFDRGMPALASIDTLDLSAGNHDAVQRGFYMASRFVEDTMLEMGSLNPHGRFVHVYLNGIYWGQYNARERLDDDFLAGYLGGSDDDYLVVRGNDNVGSNFVTGTPDPKHRESWETVRANRNSYLAVRDRLDVSHLIDFMLVWFYGNSESEFRSAGPVHPGTGFKFWLADADGFLRTSALTLDTTANVGPGGLFGALVAEGHPDFKSLLADRIHRHFFNNGALTPDRNLARLNARMAEIQDSLIAECARWDYRTPTNWESAAQTIRTGLFPQRTDNLLNLLRNRGFYPTLAAPVFAQHGGSVPDGHLLAVTADNGSLIYTLDGSDPRLPGGGTAPGALTAAAVSNTLIAAGSNWKFRDVGSLPAANWASPAYDDSGWSAGNAPLGYGTGDEATVVSFGPNASSKYMTTYFRKTIQVADPAAIRSLTFGLVRDDGAVVYLNGVEVFRSNMPAGTISFSTPAASTVSGNAKLIVHTVNIPAANLVSGNNLVAVEVHQSSGSSGDLRFDLSLVSSEPAIIRLTANTTVNARVLAGSSWSALTSADFQISHPLATAGPYHMSGWDADQPAGTTPPNLRFFQTDTPDPVLATPMDAPWTLPFDLESRSRIVGLGSSGVGFINTGNPQTTPGAGFVGAAVLTLDTRATQDIRVRWTGGTVIPNERAYGIRLQYRIGTSGPYLDLTDASGNPVEYLRHPTAGHETLIGPVALPQAAEDQPLVELRWKYHSLGGGSGARPLLRLDDIQVTAGPVPAESLSIATAPAAAQAGRPAAAVVVRALGRNGVATEMWDGQITLAIAGHPGLLQGTTTRTASGGTAVFDDLVFPSPGVFTLTAAADDLAGDTFAFPIRVAGLTELVVPAFIQGESPPNNHRVPFACLLRIDGLEPLTTYRYANQVVTAEDAPETAGAGNMIFATGHSGPFVRTSQSPRFLAGDLNLRHGEFTTGPDGSHTGWFITEPTGNFRFTPGTPVHPRLLLNDGHGGDLPFHHLTTAAAAEVIAFGSAAGHGSAVHGDVTAAAGSILVLYADADGVTRPLAATPVEDTGLPAIASWAPFYQSEVTGRAGRWGTIVPNHLPHGVRRFEIHDRSGGLPISAFATPEGHPPTTQLANGTATTGVRIPSGAGFDRWQALRFTLDEITADTVAGPLADPDGDGIANLLEYVLGGDPFVADSSILPRLTRSDTHHLFTFDRAAASAGDTTLVIQHGENPGHWTTVALDSPQVVLGPVVDGRQTVVAEIPRQADPAAAFFARIRVVATAD